MKTLPDGYKKRTSSTVPFGYEEDGLIEGYLKPIEQELEILREVSEAIFHNEISLGVGVDWLSIYLTKTVLHVKKVEDLETKNYLMFS
jgi:hypothetical protein